MFVLVLFLIGVVGATPSQIILYSDRKPYAANLGNTSQTEQLCTDMLPPTLQDCSRVAPLLSYSYRELEDWPSILGFSSNSKVTTEKGVFLGPWRDFVNPAKNGNIPSPPILDDIVDTQLQYWTGTNQVGKLHYNRNCKDWTLSSNLGAAVIGMPAATVDGWYLMKGLTLCNQPQGVVCACILKTPRPTKKPTPPTRQPTPANTQAPVS